MIMEKKWCFSLRGLYFGVVPLTLKDADRITNIGDHDHLCRQCLPRPLSPKTYDHYVSLSLKIAPFRNYYIVCHVCSRCPQFSDTKFFCEIISHHSNKNWSNNRETPAKDRDKEANSSDTTDKLFFEHSNLGLHC